MRAKQLKDLGPPEDVEYIERERHAVAVHEACHAVVAYRTRHHMEIDIATIEKGSDYLGMVGQHPAGGPVHPVALGVRGRHPACRWPRWPASGCSSTATRSSGVSGDLESATTVASFMEGYLGHGLHGVVVLDGPAAGGRQRPAAGRAAAERARTPRRCCATRWPTGSRTSWPSCWTAAEAILRDNRARRCWPWRTRWRRTRRCPATTSRPCSRAARASLGRRHRLRGPGVPRAAGGVPRGRGRGAPRPHRGHPGPARRRPPAAAP